MEKIKENRIYKIFLGFGLPIFIIALWIGSILHHSWKGISELYSIASNVIKDYKEL